MDAVLQSGLVQVGDAQRFLHPQRCSGHAGTSRLVGLLILIERAIHPAVIGMELSQREVGLHDVKRRSRGADGLFLRRQEIFERPSATTPAIDDAPGKSRGDSDSSRPVWETPAGPPPLRRARSHRSRISRSLVSRAWDVADWPRSCFGLPDRRLRPPSGWQILSESEPPDSAARGRRPRGRLSRRGATSNSVTLPRRPPASAVGSIDSAWPGR